MIYRIIPEENYKLIPLTHIPPDQEEEFFEKNKHTGLFIKVDIVTAYPDCIRYNPTTKSIYKDFNCIHRHRVEKKIKAYEQYTKVEIEKYLTKMNWGTSYYDSITEITSTLQYLEKNKSKYPEYYEYVLKLHAIIEEIWLKEQNVENKIKQTKTYEELQQFNPYLFVKNEIEPLLEEIYQFAVKHNFV